MVDGPGWTTASPAGLAKPRSPVAKVCNIIFVGDLPGSGASLGARGNFRGSFCDCQLMDVALRPLESGRLCASPFDEPHRRTHGSGSLTRQHQDCCDYGTESGRVSKRASQYARRLEAEKCTNACLSLAGRQSGRRRECRRTGCFSSLWYQGPLSTWQTVQSVCCTAVYVVPTSQVSVARSLALECVKNPQTLIHFLS